MNYSNHFKEDCDDDDDNAGEKKTKSVSYQGPDLTETMKDQIRNWFAKDKEEQGKFPEYPSDEEGGSNLIFNPDAVIHDSDGETTRRDEKGKKDEKKEGEEEEEKGFRLGPSDFLTSLKEGDKTFSGESVGQNFCEMVEFVAEIILFPHKQKFG